MRAGSDLKAEFSANATAALDAPLAAAAILDNDEIIELSLKPSLWYIVTASLRVVCVAAVVGGAAALGTRSAMPHVASWALVLGALAALVRMLIASLQWASRLYVLTNRRVIRFSGMFTVYVRELPLIRVERAEPIITPLRRALDIGTVRLTPADGRLDVVQWEDVARPEWVHETLVKAIRRSRHTQGQS